MKKHQLIDLGLIGAAAFAAVSLLAAAGTTLTSARPAANNQLAAPVSAAANRPALTWDQAQAALAPAIPADAAALFAASRGSATPTAGRGAASATPTAATPKSGAAPAAHGHEGSSIESKCKPSSERDRTVILADPSKKDGYNITYEPATPDGCRGSALRSNDPANDAPKTDSHNHAAAECHPTAGQKAVADKLLADTTKALRDRYLNQPQNAIADGFYAYPVPDTKWFHMFSSSREADQYELTPNFIESFMYAMTDEGLTPIGAMYIFAPKDQTPPNPTGCLMQWHNHTGTEGAATSFDPNKPTQSVWMAHIWIYGGVDPWGRDFDGSEAEQWFAGYRNIPALCSNSAGDHKGDCI